LKSVNLDNRGVKGYIWVMSNPTDEIKLTPSADVELADDGSRYSKAMMKLSSERRAFVEELFNMQSRDFTKAYALARLKYGDPIDLTDPKQLNVARVMASKWAHRDDIKDAIFAEGARRMTAYVPMIMEMLASIALDPSHKDAARVGLGILDRTGFGPTKKVDQTMTVQGGVETTMKIDVTDPRTAVAVRKFAEALNLNGDDFAKYLGVELAKRSGLLGGPTVDAEFTEVPEFEFVAT